MDSQHGQGRNINPPITNPAITNAHGEPRVYSRLLPASFKTCATCAPRDSQFGVVYENKSSGAMTVECTWCGNTEHMPYIPPDAVPQLVVEPGTTI